MHAEKKPGVVRVGDTILVDVFIDTEGKEINVLDGSFRIIGDVVVKKIYTGGSVFSLWPIYPQNNSNTVVFTGGTPSTIFGGRLQVLTLAITPQNESDVKFETVQVNGYLGDGNGTSITIPAKQFGSIAVEKKSGKKRDDTLSFVNSDTTAPKKFNIEYGKDSRVYGGKVFLSFNTVDDVTGIDHFEVLEMNEKTIVAGNTYVLKNQDFIGDIVVTAVDIAGNRQSEVITFGDDGKKSFPPLFYIILVCIFFVYGYFYFQKKNE